jgi:hypothetical protein
VFELNQEIKGKIPPTNKIPNTENPDIFTDKENYEIEIFSNYHKFKKKFERFRENKKHILIIKPDKRLKEFFDEIKIVV